MASTHSGVDGVKIKKSIGLMLVAASAAGLSSLPATELPQPSTGRADNRMQIAREAVARLVATDLEGRHYTRVLHFEGQTVVDRHDPTLPGEEHWQLVSVDGRTPTDRERRRHERKRADHSEQESDLRWPADFAKVIAPGSLEWIQWNGEMQRFSFELQSPDGRKRGMYRKLRGEFTVTQGPSGPFVNSLQVWSTEPFFPMAAVRLSEFAVQLEFAVDGGEVLPTGMEIQMEGEALLLKDIGREVRVAFIDHEPMGASGVDRQPTQPPDIH